MTKIILTDCDGVLMDWERTFSEWMIDNGYTIDQDYATSYNMAKKYSITEDEKTKIIKHFNESSRIGWLPPLRDAIKYVKKLHEEHGYVFHMITSLSRSPWAGKLRIENTERLFGKTAFEKYIFLDVGADKDDELVKYQNTNLLWVEDKLENANTGLKYGLNSVLISHQHNKMLDNKRDMIPRFTNWEKLYNSVLVEK